MRRLLLVLTVLLVGRPARPTERPAADRTIGERIESALRRGGLRGARVGIVVQDLASGEIVYEKGADDLLTPASLTKVVTSATALQVLTPQFRFRTGLFGTGRQAGSVWQGDVYLKAWGDPALVDERIWELVNGLRKRGIRTVEGSIKVDDSFFDRVRYGEDWGPLSRSWFAAPHGAVSVNFNTIETRGRYVAIGDDPSKYAGRYFLDMMRREGVDVKGTFETPAVVPDHAVTLVTSESKQLTEIVADLNKLSQNFIAEQLLKTLGAEVNGAPGTAEKGLRVVSSYLRKLGVADDAYKLFDGSGLSHSNRLSARVLVRVLSAVVSDFELGPEYLASLKVAGIDGRSTRFQDPLCKRRMRVKTGHLYGVAGLAGFGETVGGRRLVFAILANDYRRGRHAADRGIEDVCEAFLGAGAADGTLVARDILGAPARDASADLSLDSALAATAEGEAVDGDGEEGEEGD